MKMKLMTVAACALLTMGCGGDGQGEEAAKAAPADEAAAKAAPSGAAAAAAAAAPAGSTKSVGDYVPPTTETAEARVQILEFSDFQCPFCSRVNPTMAKIKETYKGDVAIAFLHNALPFHKDARPAAMAAVAADNQGKFWEMHDKLFADKSKRSEADFVAIATELGLDVDKFKTDWAAAGAKVQADMTMCRSHGVGGVPGFLINGRLMSGAQPFPTFKKVIEEELNGGFEATQKKAAAAGKKAG